MDAYQGQKFNTANAPPASLARNRTDSNRSSISNHSSPPGYNDIVQQQKNGYGGNNSPPSVGDFWKKRLFLLQESAPKPRCVICSYPVDNRPPYYGAEFHGSIGREIADVLLESGGEGSYLVRESQRAPGMFTLCFRFDGVTKNYKLFYDGCHYVGEKRFDTVEDLVADGLISMFIDKHAADYVKRMAEETIYEETPYSQYRKLHEHKNNHHPSQITGSAVRYCNNQSGVACCPPSSPHVKPYPSFLTPQIVCKSHKFKVHTFKGPHWCDYCGNFMWGLVQQGVKCEDCGFGAHRKCVEKIPHDCQPDMKYVKRIFGVDLTTLTMARGNPVPDVVLACVAEIEARGMDVEGIYRVSGSHEEIEKLRILFDTEGQADLSKAKVEDINGVAGLLKLYLRSLPLPLIPYTAHAELCDAMKRRYDCDKLRGAQKCLRDLPTAHRATLRSLLRHLARVAANSHSNKMDADNLARIFAPSIMPAVPSNISTTSSQFGANNVNNSAQLSQFGAAANPNNSSLHSQYGAFNNPDSSPILATANASLIISQQDQFILQFLITNCASVFLDSR